MKTFLLFLTVVVTVSCGSPEEPGTKLSDEDSPSLLESKSPPEYLKRGSATLTDIWSYLSGGQLTDAKLSIQGKKYEGRGDFSSKTLDGCKLNLSAAKSYVFGGLSRVYIEIKGNDSWSSSVTLDSNLSRACAIGDASQKKDQLYCYGGGPGNAWSLTIDRLSGEANYTGRRITEADRSKCSGLAFAKNI